jgi:hypothetical protein
VLDQMACIVEDDGCDALGSEVGRGKPLLQVR